MSERLEKLEQRAWWVAGATALSGMALLGIRRHFEKKRANYEMRKVAYGKLVEKTQDVLNNSWGNIHVDNDRGVIRQTVKVSKYEGITEITAVSSNDDLDPRPQTYIVERQKDLGQDYGNGGTLLTLYIFNGDRGTKMVERRASDGVEFLLESMEVLTVGDANFLADELASLPG